MNYKAMKKQAEAGPGKKGSGPVICRKNQYGKQCKFCGPVKELFDKANSNGDEQAEALAKNCMAKSSFAMNILPLDKKDDKEGKNCVFTSGIAIWTDLIDLLPEDENDPDGVDFTNPKKAIPIIITRTGTGRNTKYKVKSSKDDSIKITKKQLKGIVDLDELPKLLEKGEADDLEFWRPREGKNRILILPPWGNSDFFYKEISQHWRTDLLIDYFGDALAAEDSGKNKKEKKGKSKEKKGKSQEKKGKSQEKKGKSKEKKGKKGKSDVPF